MDNIYKKLYFRLFNAITRALEELEHGDSAGARLTLEQAQIQTEDMFMDGCGGDTCL